MNLHEFCLINNKEDLLKEWHPSRNGNLTPSLVKPLSRVKVWWQCANGHEWETRVQTRVTYETSCPYCNNSKVLIGYNDLATTFPRLAAEWDYKKNQNITPFEVTAGSGKKVWWRCSLGHEWQALIFNRINKESECPFCSGRKVLLGFNDLATTHPNIAREWHPTKNGQLLPTNITAKRSLKVWWISSCGHEWQADIRDRAYGNSICPFCSGRKLLIGFNDLATKYPELALEWHPSRNGKLKATEVQTGSGKTVWWRCALGHEWKASIDNRALKNSKCPYCVGKKVLVGFNDVATTNPLLCKEWHPTLNGKKTPEMYTHGSNKRIWWICQDNHVWQAKIKSRTGKKKHGCPVCAGNVNSKRLYRYQKIFVESMYKPNVE
jgi:hypothetical protein